MKQRVLASRGWEAAGRRFYLHLLQNAVGESRGQVELLAFQALRCRNLQCLSRRAALALAANTVVKSRDWRVTSAVFSGDGKKKKKKVLNYPFSVL